MHRLTKVPRYARRLQAFAEFQSYLQDFVSNLYSFLWIVGRPGLSKTEAIRTAISGRLVYYRKGGQLTPAQFYRDCYENRGRPIILDDAEHLLEDRIGRKLISALGDTGLERQLSYGTTSRVLGDTPASFTTSSSLCIIANRASDDPAIQSRAVTLFFEPTNLEIHRAVGGWFWDQEIHDWFGQHLFRLPPLDMRWYVIAERDKRAGRDWQQIALKAHTPDRAVCIIQDLEADPAYPEREAKARRFVELLGEARGASRASYFRLRQRLRDAQRLVPEAVPTIPLRRRTPPATLSMLELESSEQSMARAEDGAHPLDVPVRDAFAVPIRGESSARPPSSPRLDDTLAWETPANDDEAEETP